MSLETVTHIADLVTTNPTASDPKSQGDDHIRNIKSALANDFAGFTGAVCVTGTDGGAVNAYTLTPTNALVAYGTKMAAVFSPTITNTGAATLNISGLGTKAIKQIDGSDVTSSDLVSGSVYVAVYNGTNFRLMAPTKNYVDQLAFNTVLPAQSGNSGKALKTDGTNASWGSVGFNGVVTLTGASEVVPTHKEQLLVLNGTFALAFTAASALGTAFGCYLQNGSTGVITLDPASGELIDGLSAYQMYPYESRMLAVNSAGGLSTVVLEPFAAIFSATTSLLVPPGYEGGFDVELWGGGAGGDGANTASAGVGGGGGAYNHGIVGDYSAGVSVTITIGAGGSGGAGVSAGAQIGGGAGGDTSLGSALIALGASAGFHGAGYFPTAGGTLSSALWMFHAEPGLSSGNGFWGGSNGGGASGAAGGKSKHGGTGGGAGNTGSSAGGNGGANFAGTLGGAGNAGAAGSGGASMPAFTSLGGTGGGGGARIGPTGGAGGAGGEPSGGGGGGGCPTGASGALAGSGGAGAKGKAIVRGIR